MRDGLAVRGPRCAAGARTKWRLGCAGLFALVAVLSEAGARADPGISDWRARPRFELGAEGGLLLSTYLHAPFPPSTTSEIRRGQGFGVGHYLGIGVQIGDKFDLQLEASAVYVLFSEYARVAVTGGFAPKRWLTLSLGPVVGFVPGPTLYAGLTARADFHLATAEGARRRNRHSLTLGLAVDGGATVLADSYVGSGAAIGVTVRLGYTIH